MSQSTVICPKCGTSIDLDAIAHAHYAEELQKNELKLKENFEKEKEELRKKAVEWADKKSEERMKEHELKTKDLENQIEEMKKKGEEAMKNELELRKKSRELEEKAKSMELENARKLDEERKKLEILLTEDAKRREDESLKKMQEDNRKLLAEKEKQMDILRKSLEEANRKAVQWSQQIQGEIQENELKHLLEESFRADEILDVPTGIRGADLVQNVRNDRGRTVGIILWESKNTKAFSTEWVKKLKDDRVIAKADVCIIVSSVLPEGIKHFGLYDGVWISESAYAIPLAAALRDKLLSLEIQSQSLSGREEKMEILYNYLASSEFKSKIENIIEAFKSMKEDLESEKRAMTRIWSRREKELERIISNTGMLYGDMQGIMGNALQTVAYLELPSGDESENENKEEE